MSGCEKYIEQISAMVDGELTAEQLGELRTHIDACDECRRVYDAFSGISGALTEELVTPPETLAAGVMYKINLKNKSGAGRRFAFGRFTVAAACLALALFGASHFGLLDGLSSKISEPAALSKAADENTYAMGSSLEDNYLGDGASLDPESSTAPETSRQTQMTAGVPETQCEGTVIQFGFSAQDTSSENGFISEKGADKPSYLVEATQLSVYEGNYWQLADDKSKNELLFTLDDEQSLSELTALLTAVPDDTAEYSEQDKEFLKQAPIFTLFIPADKEKDREAKDKTISVWYVSGEIWCAAQDVCENFASSPDTSEAPVVEKTVYKAVGLPDKLDDLIKKLKDAK